MTVFVLKVWCYEDTKEDEKNRTYIFDIFKNEEDAEKWKSALNTMFNSTNQPKGCWYDAYKVK